ncbi:BatD family protein [Frateuria aurantia]
MRLSRRIGAVLVLLPCLARAEIVATLDRSQAQLGDTLTLNLQATGSSQLSNPDLAPLQRDFAILGTSNSSSIQIVNGVRTASSTIGVALQPLHAGHLVVPAIRVGGESTRPLTVDVSDAPVSGGANAAASGARGIILEGTVSPASVYVGQQAIYTLRLYFAVTIANGGLDDPQASGLDVHRIGSDADYQTTRGGRRYNVVERRYTVTPEHAGTIRIPALRFQGQVVDPNDPNAFFGAVTPASAIAPPVDLQVTPIPGNWGSSAWLPSSQVKLSLTGLPASGGLTVGQPVTVDMRLEAQGVPASGLPALSLPSLAGAQVYPDKASSQDQSSGQGVRGVREQRFAIVPERPGKLTIPETTVKWWNLRTHQAEFATIPAQTLEVQAAAGQPAAAAAASSLPAAAASTASGRPLMAVVAANPWRGLAFGLLLLWLLTMLLGLWWWRRRARRSTVAKARVEPTLASAAIVSPPVGRGAKRGALQQAFLQAAQGGDASLQEASLLAWARSERPAVRQLGDLQQALAEGAQTLAIAELQRARYGGGGAVDGNALAAAFSGGFQWRDDVASGERELGLPPLYPFKLD